MTDFVPREPLTVAKTIMTVDDSPSMRMLLRVALTDLGYSVVEAEDGVHALEKLDGFQPDLLITDINMPRMDGFGLISEVRSGASQPADPGADHRKLRRKEAARPRRRRNRLDRQAVPPRKARGRHPPRSALTRFPPED